MISFFVPCDPPKGFGKNNKRAFVAGGRAVVVENPRSKDAKSFLAGVFAAHAPKTPLEGPVSVAIYVTYPWTKSTSKRTRELGVRPKVTRPDVDAINTTILDVLQSLQFFKDDSQVWAVRTYKQEGLGPGIRIEVQGDGS